MDGADRMKLSKTNYLLYRECRHNAWLKVHRPDVFNAVALTEFDQHIIETGNDVDVLARDNFPGGVLIERGDWKRTRELMAARTPVLYQPYFETSQFVTACDILVWNEASQVYDLFEVKSSSSNDKSRAKTDLYTHDVAFQAEVLRQAGVTVGTLNVVRLNSEYRRAERLDLKSLFAVEDFSARAAGVRDAVAVEMDEAHDVLASDAPLPAPCLCMEKGRSAHCSTFPHTNPEVPAYSVHDITRIGASKKKLGELIGRGILRIEDVPDDFDLSAIQRNQVEAARLRRAQIDRSAIAEFLAHMSYPVAFLDYETFPAAVPRFPGYKPFNQIPFQFSLDVVAKPGGDVEHFEFLHTSGTNPDGPFIEALRTYLPASGSIVVWNQTFEGGINELLGERNPEAHDFMASLDPRIVDLMDVFSTQAYVHPDFKGRTSIKSILPVLVPALSYKGLAIREGATASARWNELVTGEVKGAEANAIQDNLLAYCGLDTRAMVEIWWALGSLFEDERKIG